jgi:hypothetical protein
VPAKPAWLSDLPSICDAARAVPRPLLERSDLEHLLQVGRRRAQQILEGCTTGRVGASYVTTAEALIAHLRGLGSGDAAGYELRRRQKVGRVLAALQKEWTVQPKVPVEAPVSVVNQELADLPDGVELRPGEIRVRFRTPHEALEKLLALAMAAGNDLDGFERQTVLL